MCRRASVGRCCRCWCIPSLMLAADRACECGTVSERSYVGRGCEDVAVADGRLGVVGSERCADERERVDSDSSEGEGRDRRESRIASSAETDVGMSESCEGRGGGRGS